MGTNLTPRLDVAGPQSISGVCPPLLAELAVEGAAAGTREVLRCPSCQLNQYRTHNSQCRRCHAGLDAPPAAALPLAVLGALHPASLEPGIETAAATGIPVPDVAGAIRAWRQRRGLSQRQLAERMAVPRTYVSKIENDKATPTIASLRRVASAMDTSVATLLEAAASTEAILLDDAFVRALLPFLPSLSRRHQGRLLDASRHLAGA
ncbi:MAG TPA: helix-turn-helix transcriptional regulator [Terriglobales bacterium]|nr:helix-turn-helix transcriptional regulator [Terriglobales bacterium]